MRSFWSDIRFSIRVLLNKPGFTSVAVLTLALAIGVNTAIFSAVDGMILRPLPYRDPGRLVFLSEDSKAFPGMSISPPDLLDWQAQDRVFEHLSGYRSDRMVFSGAGTAELVRGAEVNETLFSTLGVAPIAGRTILPEEDRPGGARVTVISEGLAIRHFGSARDALGKTVNLDGEAFGVVGVMPAAFHFPSAASEIWVALMPGVDTSVRGNHPGIAAVARMRTGVSLEQARTEMSGIAARLAESYPVNKGTGALVIPLADHVVGDRIRVALWLLSGAAAFVLLIACANVINLMLARATGRGREIAVRSALGATPWRIARILTTESLLVSVAGGILGVELASWGVEAIKALVPAGTPRAAEVSVSTVVLLFTMGISVVAGLVVGVVPAWRASRPDLVEALKQGGRSSTGGPGRSRTRAILVVSEVALSLMLLIGSGLLAQSFLRVLATNPGLDPSNVLTMQFSFTGAKYTSPEPLLNFLDPLLAKIRTMPGVASAGAISPLPLSGENQFTSFVIEGRALRPVGEALTCDYALASPDYFRTMRISLLRGRFFTEEDLRSAVRPVIIDAALAQRDFSGEDPIGKRISIGGGAFDLKYARTIVGIVGHVMNYGVDAASAPVMFEPTNQIPFNAMTLVIRASGETAPIISAVREEVAHLDPAMPVFNIAPMERVMAGLSASRRLSSTLLGGFSLLALILAAVGIYGVISYGVSQRTHEIGLRMALGAEPGAMLRMVVGEGLRLALVGIAIGWFGAWALGRVIAGQLFGVTSLDPKTYLGMAALLAIVAALGSWLPARRATRVDPLIALRYE